MEIFKILAVCLITAVLALVLKSYKAEYALVVILGGGVILGIYIFKGIAAPIEYIKSLLNIYSVKTEYFSVALKALGIGYVTSFIADACRDSGQTSLAAKAELAGKCAIFILSVPLIVSVLEIALGLVK